VTACVITEKEKLYAFALLTAYETIYRLQNFIAPRTLSTQGQRVMRASLSQQQRWRWVEEQSIVGAGVKLNFS